MTREAVVSFAEYCIRLHVLLSVEKCLLVEPETMADAIVKLQDGVPASGDTPSQGLYAS